MRNDADPADSAIEIETFERFPYGLLVFDGNRTLIRWNETARDLLPGVTGEPAPTCCDVLGCGRTETPLAGRCLTRTAAGRGGALPEVRIDLPDGGPVGGAWVMAAPLRADGSRIAVQVRPGEAHDRRRGRVPEGADFELRIYTFGRLRIESQQGPLAGRWLDGRAGQILMHLLCERHRVVRTDEIMDTVWAGTDLRTPGNVRYFVHRLRSYIEPNRPARSRASVVVARQGGYALDRSRVWVDADVFEEHARSGIVSLRRGIADLARHALEQALEVYQGDFLAEVPYAEWALGERDRLRAIASDVLRALVRLSLNDGDRARAAVLAERLAALQPFDSAAQRRALALMLADGRRSDAIRHYAAFRERLGREFAEDPEFELGDLGPADERAD